MMVHMTEHPSNLFVVFQGDSGKKDLKDVICAVARCLGCTSSGYIARPAFWSPF